MDSESGTQPKVKMTAGPSPMKSKTDSVILTDKGGRRVGIERRSFSYTCYIPERRSGMERRNGEDRRRIQRLTVLPENETPPDERPQDSRFP
jgi:hypothetical protein